MKKAPNLRRVKTCGLCWHSVSDDGPSWCGKYNHAVDEETNVCDEHASVHDKQPEA